MTDETTGVVFFAYNTEQINYLKLATLAAHYVRRHMPEQSICVITDSASWEWFSSTADGGRADQVFDDVVLTTASNRPNKRVHYDSPYTKFVSAFKNGNKHRVFEFSPYDRTLLLDTDYIVQNADLEYVFDTESSVTLFHGAETLVGLPPHPKQQYLNEAGIPMMWSTAVYFNKNHSLTEEFFNMWAHVADNYEFYTFLYGFPGDMFRTDFCVSIAAHLLNGMGPGELIEDFPQDMIYMSQRDDIIKINDIDDWVFLVNDREEEWVDTATRITNENLHVMNKRALERRYDELMERFEENT